MLWDLSHIVTAKSQALCSLMIDLAAERCAGIAWQPCVFSPGHGYEVMQPLIERGVIGNFRDPEPIATKNMRSGLR